MHLEKSKVIHPAVSVIMIIAGFYNASVLGDPLHLFYSIVAAVFYEQSVGLLRLLTGFSWCLLASGLSSFSTVLSVVLPFFLVYSYEDPPRRSSDTYLSLKLLVVALIFTPLYLLRIQALIPVASYVTSVLAMTFLSYARLSRSQVILSRESFSAYLGDYVKVPLKIESKHKVFYKVLLDEGLFTEGLVEGSKDLVIKLSPNMTGVKVHSIKVVLSDLRGFSRITYGPFMIRVKAVPKSLTIVREVREIISKYVESIRPPMMYVGRLEASVSSRASVSKSSVGSEAGSEYTSVSATELGAGPADSAIGEGIKYRFRWVLPTKILKLVEFQTPKTFLGDYIGAREYYPGDHPRSIHWKKSMSTGELIVKVYTRSDEGGDGKPSLIIADWDASNPVELDNLIQATYSALLLEKHVKILYLKLPDSKVYLIRGSTLEVLKTLDLVISSEDIESRFNYESWVRKGIQDLTEEFRVADEPLRSIDKYYRVLSESIVDELKKQGLPKNSSFMIIHPKAHAIKYLYLTHKLRMSGHTTIHLTKILQPKEVGEKLREIIKLT